MIKMKVYTSIFIFIILGAMFVHFKNEKITPHKQTQKQHYVLYEDNLNYEEKANAGLLGITSIRNVTNIVNNTIETTQNVINWITGKVKKSGLLKWPKITVPLLPSFK